jgi:hypothetical protein
MNNNKQHGGTMTYAEKLADNCMMSFLLSGASEEECIKAHIEKAMQAQREATLQRLNQYALDTAGEVMPPEMQFLILHTEIAEVKV